MLHGQSVARISKELGIHVFTLYKWIKAWRLQGDVVPVSEKGPEGPSATYKFKVVLESAGLNATKLSFYQGAGPFPRAGGAVAAGIPGCPPQASAHLERAKGAG